MTSAQTRLLNTIRAYGGGDGGAEYWPVANDWVKDAGPAKSFALKNINATVAALLRSGVVILDEDGLFHLVEVEK